MSCQKCLTGLLVVVAMVCGPGCDQSASDALPGVGEPDRTVELEQLARQSGVRIPQADVVLLRAGDGGGRDAGFGYYRWAVFCPAPIKMPPIDGQDVVGPFEMPLPTILKLVETIVGKGRIPKPSSAFMGEWTTNTFQFRGSLLRSSNGDYLIVERFNRR